MQQSGAGGTGRDQRPGVAVLDTDRCGCLGGRCSTPQVGGGAEPSQLRDFYSEYLFGEPSLAYARQMASRGCPTWVYRFDWQSPTGIGSCHFLEIAFVLNNLSRWRGARMLEGIDPSEFSSLVQRMQLAWTAFARRGPPGHRGLPEWPDVLMASSGMRFDQRPELVPLSR